MYFSLGLALSRKKHPLKFILLCSNEQITEQVFEQYVDMTEFLFLGDMFLKIASVI